MLGDSVFKGGQYLVSPPPLSAESALASPSRPDPSIFTTSWEEIRPFNDLLSNHIVYVIPEKFLLRFKFDKNYPMEAPEVTFVVTDGWQAPEREHALLHSLDPTGNGKADIMASDPVYLARSACVFVSGRPASVQWLVDAIAVVD